MTAINNINSNNIYYTVTVLSQHDESFSVTFMAVKYPIKNLKFKVPKLKNLENVESYLQLTVYLRSCYLGDIHIYSTTKFFFSY